MFFFAVYFNYLLKLRSHAGQIRPFPAWLSSKMFRYSVVLGSWLEIGRVLLLNVYITVSGKLQLTFSFSVIRLLSLQ